MRYAIGIEMISKKTGQLHAKGYYAWDFGGAILKVGEENLDYPRLYIAQDLESARKFVRECSIAYRRDDVWLRTNMKSQYIRNFFLLKVDSPKFRAILDESSAEKSKSNPGIFFYKLKGWR